MPAQIFAGKSACYYSKDLIRFSPLPDLFLLAEASTLLFECTPSLLVA